ncbi:hypothetical protein LSH36_275g08041 [Paralvinella palmiformis]|uniref:Uncharacterized protein n=1 Tax=Paralvinella palmiformis TaxID=53620 RepID=A0AAD9N1Y8_9ANNE|nr:hypothetical protein LSH36_275g08041 [Paralvinella palmiformis]
MNISNKYRCGISMYMYIINDNHIITTIYRSHPPSRLSKTSIHRNIGCCRKQHKGYQPFIKPDILIMGDLIQLPQTTVAQW